VAFGLYLLVLAGVAFLPLPGMLTTVGVGGGLLQGRLTPGEW